MSNSIFLCKRVKAIANQVSFINSIRLRAFTAAVILLLSFFSSHAQTNGWYRAKEIGPKIWVINEPGMNDNMYLLEGTDSTLLIDAGFGLGNLRDFVKTLSSKPLTVVNTHAHPDHTGGNYQFPKVHIGAADLESAKSVLDPKVTRQIAAQVMKDTHIADSLKFPDTLHVAPTVLLPVKDGHVFRLGGRDVQVMALPGHTPGSICLLDSKTGSLFTGDTMTETWLFFKESLPVEVYLASLKKLNKSKSKFNKLIPGHGSSLNFSVLDESIKCCEQILSGKCEAKPYHSFLGIDGLSCTYQSVTIAYDPGKVKKK